MGRDDEDVYRCLAWLYDGFPLPSELPSPGSTDAAAPARAAVRAPD
jgi:hypothetical protein